MRASSTTIAPNPCPQEALRAAEPATDDLGDVAVRRARRDIIPVHSASVEGPVLGSDTKIVILAEWSALLGAAQALRSVLGETPSLAPEATTNVS